MDYQQTIDFLFASLPMFHRIGPAAYRADLNNILAISELTGQPQLKFKSIHIAGTNGKGSVSNMLASIFQEAGYKTGLFTSPHLIDFRERIRINGEMISEEYVVRFVDDYKSIFDDIKPSFFEWTTALAFSFFADKNVDVAIIETGLGGRLDSTNIIKPELSIITNISFDHMNLLGDSLEKIAVEKAGIIKENITVVVGERQAECDFVFIDKAKELKSELFFASDHFSSVRKTISVHGQIIDLQKDEEKYSDNLELSLQGIYQLKNICTVAQSVEILKEKFNRLNEKAFVEGVGNVQHNTGLRGRWEILTQHPLTITDVGHNEGGIRLVTEQLRELMLDRKNAKLHIVFGMVNDKDSKHVLSLLPENATYYFCKAALPRALDVDELATNAALFNLLGEKYSSVAAAYSSARQNAKEQDVIFIGGSTFVVAEALLSQ